MSVSVFIKLIAFNYSSLEPLKATGSTVSISFRAYLEHS